MDQYEEAFRSFKTFLTTPPILQRSDHKTDLLLYLVVAESTISAVIVQEHQKTQTPVYFISRVLQDTEKRYQTIEKLVLALVTTARRLRPYFQSHQVIVKTDYQIKQILRKSELAGRIIAWSVELSEFGIQYESRGALKAQCLANFVAELTPTSVEEPQVTNNQAEYEALLAGLRLTHDLGAWRVRCNSDSKLMVEQLSGTYQANDVLLQRHFHMASQQISSFDEFTIQHVPREQNTRADLLSKLASTKSPGQHRTIIQESLHSPNLDDKVITASDSEDQGWMTGIWSYLKVGVLPEGRDEARKMRLRSAKFVIIGDELFKHGISTPLLKCLTAPQAAYDYVQKCKECQQFSNSHQQPPKTLYQMMSSWPFAQWGMDILGPFPPAKGQHKFLLVAIDYFTKWIEACPLARITTENIRKFTWKSIVCRFGIPHSLVTDNG
ncbi:uncharacterized protein LOC109812505 [Cajanus cajan]|uniref:uncharacterized protein LOC109812505 n=1 Tax=Cajanus cajan TaxID=3821 RepID=UPI00098D7FBB|nr:uncharacterized protein LOC109812505 [Cajanus cajan]